MTKTPSILITGAAGFTGVHACEYFRRQGMYVSAVCRRLPAGGLPADEIRLCDVTDREQVQALVRQTQPDYVLHLAGMNDVRRSWQDPLTCMNVNVAGTLHLLGAAAMQDKKPAVLVVGSSLSFDPGEDPPQPTHPYALSKTMQALAARAWSHLFQLPVMAAEPTNLIGPGTSAGLCGLLADHIARSERGLTSEPFRLSSLTEKRNYLDVRDAVAAYEKILLHGAPGSLYRFGSKQLRSIGDVLRVFETACGKQVRYINLDAAPRDPDPSLPPDEALARLGWAPHIPFEQSIADILHDARTRLTKPYDGMDTGASAPETSHDKEDA